MDMWAVPSVESLWVKIVSEKISNNIKGGRGGKREGAGRKRGAPNKVTAQVKTLAQEYGEQAISVLAKLMVESDSPQAQIAAAKELLDRGYGKVTQHTELSGTVNTGLPQFIIAQYDEEADVTSH